MADLDAITIPTPPRLTGNVQADMLAFQDYSYKLYAAVVVEGRLLPRLNAIAKLEAVSESASNPPTQAEVQALAVRINQIINASK